MKKLAPGQKKVLFLKWFFSLPDGNINHPLPDHFEKSPKNR
jgi:hypothetical protein